MRLGSSGACDLVVSAPWPPRRKPPSRRYPLRRFLKPGQCLNLPRGVAGAAAEGAGDLEVEAGPELLAVAAPVVDDAVGSVADQGRIALSDRRYHQVRKDLVECAVGIHSDGKLGPAYDDTVLDPVVEPADVKPDTVRHYDPTQSAVGRFNGNIGQAFREPEDGIVDRAGEYHRSLSDRLRNLF